MLKLQGRIIIERFIIVTHKRFDYGRVKMFLFVFAKMEISYQPVHLHSLIIDFYYEY